ncbi:MFS transporter [Agromyces larvae]|uniref:MFS transporter n=1 Tax=Agromyces larvae TaxID=2929802 RepID=A0ABY4C3L2_9MICO|nr:MFS transporter [Agromyces larvae]UOE44761.1 MFS transporter [Agromyces larvae]
MTWEARSVHDVDAARRPPREHVLFAAASIGALANGVAGSAAALLAERVGGGMAVAGLPQAMLVIGTAVAALGISAASRGGRRVRSLAVGAVAAAVGAMIVVGAAIVASFPALLAGSLLFGAGNAAVMLSRYAAAERAQPARRVRALTALLVATSVGAVVGPLLLEPSDRLGQALGLPPLAGCFVLGAAAFVVAAAAFTAVPVPPRADASTGSHEAAPDGAPAASHRRRDTVVGVGVLSLANLVMVLVMTALPMHVLHLHDGGLQVLGVVIALHVAAMFAPAPLSGFVTGRLGAERAAGLAAAVLAGAAVLAAVAPAHLPTVSGAVVVIGLGWNLALVAGSAILARDAVESVRLRREGWGEVGMGVAAAGGGAASGVALQVAGFAGLAIGAGCIAVALLGWAVAARRRPAPASTVD